MSRTTRFRWTSALAPVVALALTPTSLVAGRPGPPRAPASARSATSFQAQLVSNLPSGTCHSTDGSFSSCSRGREWNGNVPLRFEHATDGGTEPLLLHVDHDPAAGIVHVMLDWVGGTTPHRDWPYVRLSRGSAGDDGDDDDRPFDAFFDVHHDDVPVGFTVKRNGFPAPDDLGVELAVGFGPSPNSAIDHFMLELAFPLEVLGGTDRLVYLEAGFPTSRSGIVPGGGGLTSPCLVPIQWHVADPFSSCSNSPGCTNADHAFGDCCAYCPTAQQVGALLVISSRTGAASAQDLPLRDQPCLTLHERRVESAVQTGVLTLEPDAWSVSRRHRLDQLDEAAEAAHFHAREARGDGIFISH